VLDWIHQRRARSCLAVSVWWCLPSDGNETTEKTSISNSNSQQQSKPARGPQQRNQMEAPPKAGTEPRCDRIISHLPTVAMRPRLLLSSLVCASLSTGPRQDAWHVLEHVHGQGARAKAPARPSEPWWRGARCTTARQERACRRGRPLCCLSGTSGRQ
jgi:hypothetical protein